MKPLTSRTFASLLFLAFFVSASAYSPQEKISISDYISNATYVEVKKSDMMKMSSYTHNFAYVDDAEFESQDPSAYWLMNRMLQTSQSIESADDAWAWEMMVDESIREYHRRLGRKDGSDKLALLAVEELMGSYYAGNQWQMNCACGVMSWVAYYDTLSSYYRYIHYFKDCDLTPEQNKWIKGLLYLEYTEWFNMNKAMKELLLEYTVAAAGYSALPMQISCTHDKWASDRNKELEIERCIDDGFGWKPYSTQAEEVSVEKFDELVAFYKGINKKAIIKQYIASWGGAETTAKDYKEAKDRIGNSFDCAKISKIAERYALAISNWRDMREWIAETLPEEKRSSYRALTRQIHTRLYNELLELKQLWI